MVLFAFCTLRELIQVIGPEKGKEIFLGIRPTSE